MVQSVPRATRAQNRRLCFLLFLAWRNNSRPVGARRNSAPQQNWNNPWSGSADTSTLNVPLSGGRVDLASANNEALFKSIGGDRAVTAREQAVTQKEQERAAASALDTSSNVSVLGLDQNNIRIEVPTFSGVQIEFEKRDDGSTAIKINTDLAAVPGEPAYQANAVIVLTPDPEAGSVASHVIDLLVQRFEDGIKGFEMIGNPDDPVYSGENRLLTGRVQSELIALEKNLRAHSKDPPQSLKDLLGLDAGEIPVDCVRIHVESLDVPTPGKAVTIPPPTEATQTVLAESDTGPAPLQSSQATVLNSSAYSSTLESLTAWAHKSNEAARDHNSSLQQDSSLTPEQRTRQNRDYITTITPVIPQESVQSQTVETQLQKDLRDVHHTFGRHEAFIIEDSRQSNSQWDSIRVDRNIDGTFITLSAGKEPQAGNLQFRIGSRNMTQEALENRLDQLVTLMSEEASGLTIQNGEVQISDAELITELLKTTGNGEGVTLVKAENISFHDVNWIGVSLQGCTLENCSFKNCFISAVMKDTDFHNCTVSKCRIDIQGADGMNIHGSKSVWDKTVEVSGTIHNATISGKSFAVNALAVESWHGTNFIADQAASIKSLISGIMINYEASNGFPKSAATSLVYLTSGEVNGWMRSYGLTNSELEARILKQNTLFHSPDGTAPDLQLIWSDMDADNAVREHCERRIPMQVDKDIRVIWYGDNDNKFFGGGSFYDQIKQPFVQTVKSVFGTSTKQDRNSHMAVYYRTNDESGAPVWQKSSALSAGNMPTNHVAANLGRIFNDIPGVHAVLEKEFPAPGVNEQKS